MIGPRAQIKCVATIHLRQTPNVLLMLILIASVNLTMTMMALPANTF